MSIERPYTILDIGIGQGGDYLQHETGNILRIGLDLEIQGAILYKKRSLDNLVLVRGTAQKIPLQDKSVDQIEIYFPYLCYDFPSESLLSPGLQKPEPPVTSWYREFFRILKPLRRLVIWGDNLIDLESVQKNAFPYFQITNKEALYQNDLISIGTSTALNRAEPLSEKTTDPLGVKLVFTKMTQPDLSVKRK